MDERRGSGECPWDGELALHDAMTADPATRRRALPPEEAAWRWLTHADPRDDDARELQIARLRSGLDLLVVHARLHASSCRPVVAAAPQLSELVALAVQAQRPIEPVTTFIEIVLVDEAGNPIAGEPYELELPDGRVRCGALDEGGFARVDGIPIGACTVRFPRCHRDEVEAA